MFNFFNSLPHCDKLFKKFIDPWYPQEERRGITRPDIYTISAYNGQSLDIDSLQYLSEDLLTDTKEHIHNVINSAKEGYQDIISFNDFSIEVLDKVDRYFNKQIVQEIIKDSDPKNLSNSYVIMTSMFGAMLGDMFSKQQGYKWLYSYPYLNSIIVHEQTGIAITVFDWAIKKFSSYGIDDGFAEKFKMALKTIEEDSKRGGMDPGETLITYKKE